MRIRLAVLLAMMPLIAGAQRGGGMPGGHPSRGPQPGRPGTMPNPPGRPGFGGRPFGNGRGRPVFVPVGAYWPFDSLWGGCGSPFYPGAFPYGPANGFCDAGYYQPPAPPPESPPPVNIIVTPPPAYIPTPIPIPVPAVSPPAVADFSNSFRVNTAGEAPADPVPAVAVPKDYPPLVVLTSGGMYSVSKYWIENQKLYFTTTQGRTLYAPLNQVERVYPAKPASQRTQ